MFKHFRIVGTIYVLISLIFLSGCIYEMKINNANYLQENKNNYKEGRNPENYEIETISINGVSKEENIDYEGIINLKVNGIDNVIKVEKNTKINELEINGENNVIYLSSKYIKEISINGLNIVIYLPKDANPLIDDNGINTKILRY